MKVDIDLDTPAGRQAAWRFEHLATNDTDLTAEDVTAHIDPRALQGGTPESYVERQHRFARWLGFRRIVRILDTRSESPFDVEVRYELDDASTWTHAFRVSEDAPHRIIDMQISVADDELPEGTGPDRSLVHCIDHFFVAVAEPKPALDLLTERLGLAGWPWVPNADGTGTTAVEMGNAQFELLNFTMYEAFKPHTPARVQGIAFEPPPIVDAFVAEIDRRGLPHTPPMSTGTFTNVFFGGLIRDPTAVVFVCRYQCRATRARSARRAAFDASGGGELGVTGVVELVIGSHRPQTLIERWQNLLDPIAPVDPGYWRIGEGPAIRIVEDSEDAVREIVLGVRSLEDAASRVRDLDVGTTQATDEGLLLDLPPLNGLRIRLAAS